MPIATTCWSKAKRRKAASRRSAVGLAGCAPRLCESRPSSGDELRINVLVKPIRSGLKTNLVITTSRRTYLLGLTSTERAWVASVSWDYPRDRMLALQRQAQAAQATTPVDTGPVA